MCCIECILSFSLLLLGQKVAFSSVPACRVSLTIIAFRLIGGVGSAGRSRCIICARWLLSCCSTSRLPLLTGSIHLREKNPSPSPKKTSTVGCINLATFAFYLRSFSAFHFPLAAPAYLPSRSSPDRMDRKRVNEKAAEAMESFFSELSKCLARRRGLFSLGGH